MGLSIISTKSASNSLAATPVAAELINGLPGDFASLLSDQTLAGQMPPVDVGTASGSAPKKSGQEDAESGGMLTMDPAALVAMLGNIPLKPESAPRINGSLKQPEDVLHDGVSDASEIPFRNLKEAGTANIGSTPQERLSPSLPEPGNERASFSATADKTAIIAAENPAAPGENTSFAAGLATATQARDIPAETHATIAKPAHTETWPQQFSEKITWMAKNDQQTAQINIIPPQLGPVQITLNLSGDNANLLFSSPHAEVRQIIESALPQLREMLASAGISLGESNVGANMAQQNPNNPFMMANKNQSTLENAILPANDAVPIARSGQVPKAGHGLVDLFA